LQLPLERLPIRFRAHRAHGQDRVLEITSRNHAHPRVHVQRLQRLVATIRTANWPTILPPREFPGSHRNLHEIAGAGSIRGVVNSRPTPGASWTYVGGGLPWQFRDRRPPTSTSSSAAKGDFTVGKNDWNWEAYASRQDQRERSAAGRIPIPSQNAEPVQRESVWENFDISSLPGYFPLAVTGHCTTGLPIFNHDGSVDNTPSVSKDCSDYAVLRMNDSTQLEQTSLKPP
jgi:hypothetical protein